MRARLNELLELFDQAALNGGLEPADLEKGLLLKARLRGDVEKLASAKAHVDEALRVFAIGFDDRRGIGIDPQVARQSISRAAWNLSEVFDAESKDVVAKTILQPTTKTGR